MFTRKINHPRIFLILLFPLVVSCASLLQKNATVKKDYVILLHGLGRTERSMVALENQMSRFGFRVVNIGYPSRDLPIEGLVEFLYQRLQRFDFAPGCKINFVTHSMGGIILRYYLKVHKMKNLARVVMLSPPNHGSELAKLIKETRVLKPVFGPASVQLSTDSLSVPNRLGPVDFNLGIITGDKNLNPFYAFWFSGKNDGKVSVKSAKITGMRDFLVVHESHRQIIYSKEVWQQIAFFLENGKFKKEDSRVTLSGFNKKTAQK